MSAVQFGQLDTAEAYGICVSGALFAWDYIITFQQERNLIWKAKWTFGKALFLAVRYTGFFLIAGWFFVAYGNPVSDLSCTVVLYLCMCSGLFTIICAGLVLALRTWAIWDRHIAAGCIVGVSWVAVTITIIVYLVYSMIDVIPHATGGIPGLVGCGVGYTPGAASASLKSFIALATYEGLIFLMTLSRGWKYLSDPSALMQILYRDAFLASVTLMSLTIADAILSSADNPQFCLPYMISVGIYVVSPCRIILNLRETTGYADDWDLATTVRPQNSEDRIPLSRERW